MVSGKVPSFCWSTLFREGNQLKNPEGSNRVVAKSRSRRPFIYTCLILAALLPGLFLIFRTLSEPEGLPLDKIIRDERAMMGTTWLIQISLAPEAPTAQTRADMEDVFLELSRIERLMSEWKEDSPVSRINASAGKELVAVPAELRSMIERSILVSRQTDGAFDVTWKGMAHLWHFDESFTVPNEVEIQSALKLVNFRMIQIDGDRIGLARTGMALGLGGIAKGYAIDRAAVVLRERGYRNFLVNGGGDVLTAGTRAGSPWRVGVRSPRGGNQQLLARLNLKGGAVVTSGDYERFKIVNGVRYHHILDPRTGRPATASQAVTIVGHSAEEADALATAVFVLGPPGGLQLVSQRAGVEALIIDASGRFHMTKGFKELAEFF